MKGSRTCQMEVCGMLPRQGSVARVNDSGVFLKSYAGLVSGNHSEGVMIWRHHKEIGLS